jgi:hypothetical protein
VLRESAFDFALGLPGSGGLIGPPGGFGAVKPVDRYADVLRRQGFVKRDGIVVRYLSLLAALQRIKEDGVRVRS